MGLDVYVGSLTRYYLGDWETIVQRIAREQGFDVQIVRQNASQPGLIQRVIDAVTRRDRSKAASKAVARWRETLGKASGLGASFDWNESPV